MARRVWRLEGISNHAHKSLKAFPQFQSYFKMRKIDAYIDVGRFGYIMGNLLFPVLNKSGKVVDIIIRHGKSKSTIRYILLSGNGKPSSRLYSPDWSLVEKSEYIYCPFGVIDSWSFSIFISITTEKSTLFLKSTIGKKEKKN